MANGVDYFGNINARWEQKFRLYPDIFDKIMEVLGSNNSGVKPYIISGIKGSGKTALKRILEEQYKQTYFCRSYDKITMLIPPIAIDNSESYFHLASNWLLIEICNTILKSIDFYDINEVKNSIGPIWAKIRNALTGLFDEVIVEGIDLRLIKLNFDRIPKKFHISNIPEDLYENNLKRLLQKKPVFILIDDFDSVFSGATDNFNIVDGALSAVANINERFQGLLTILVFPKISLSLLFRKNGRDADQISPNRYIDISWSESNLIDLITRRIVEIRNPVNISDPNKVWELEFDDVVTIQKLIVSMSMNGPRDVINIANLAKANAGDDKIKLSNVKNILNGYVTEKMQLLNAQYSLLWKKIGDIVRKLSIEVSGKISKEDLEIQLRKFNINIDLRVYPEWLWFVDSDLDELIKILYQVGFIGYKSDTNSKIIFFFNNPDISDIINKKQFVVHKIFSYLRRSRATSKKR